MAPFIFTREAATTPTVDEGMYNVKIASAKPAVAKDSGNLMINLRLEIEGDDDERKRVIWDKLVFAPGYASERIVQCITAIGWTAEDVLFDKEITPEFTASLAEQLQGEVLSVKVVLKPDSRGQFDDDGNERPYQPNVNKYLPYGSAKNVDTLL